MKKEIRKCNICGSTKKTVKTDIGILCGKHYIQYRRYGKILPRSKYDPNEFIIKEKHVYIHLYDKNGNKTAEAIVDLEAYDYVIQHKWCLDKAGYVKNSKQEYLHRIIMDTTTDYVDHIDGNRLNNTKSNLRVCSNADNLKNRTKLPTNNTSGILGVHYRKDRKKWYAELTCDKEVYRLGSFKNKEDAIKARIEAEIEYFGEYKSKILNNETDRI